jgi:hypothetical protein
VVCLQEEFDLDVCDYLHAHLHDDLDPTATATELSLMDEADVETASLPQNKDRSSSIGTRATSAPGTASRSLFHPVSSCGVQLW